MTRKIKFQMKNRPVPLRKRGVAGAEPLRKKSARMWGVFNKGRTFWESVALAGLVGFIGTYILLRLDMVILSQISFILSTIPFVVSVSKLYHMDESWTEGGRGGRKSPLKEVK